MKISDKQVDDLANKIGLENVTYVGPLNRL